MTAVAATRGRLRVPPTLQAAAAAAVLGLAVVALAPSAAVLARLGALSLMTAAAAGDIRTRRIRNALVAPALVLAIAGAPAVASAALGALVAPLPLLAMALLARGAMGMGDVKLLSPAGALVGLSAVTQMWLAVALTGGALALVVAAHSGRRGSVPYGVAITAGTALVLLTAAH